MVLAGPHRGRCRGRTRGNLRDLYPVHYRRVLAIDPENREARQGLDAVAQRYADLAGRKVAAYQYAEARELIGRGLTVRPGHGGLLALRERASLSNAPKQALGGLKRFFD